MIPSPTQPIRSRPPGPILALVGTALIVVLAACGSASGSQAVASLSPSGSTGPSSQPAGGSDTRPSALAYARCMRSHGVKDFPDPNADGDIQLNAAPGSDLDMNNSTFKAADAACKSLRPTGKQPAGLKDANLKYATCMRSHGVTDFPDPAPDGSLQLKTEPGGDLDPNNPTFKSADQACKKYLPSGGQGGSVNSDN